MDGEVRKYLKNVTGERRRRDAETLVALMARVTGEPPLMWGTIVGFGEYQYRYPSGREGTGPAASFAARSNAVAIYLVDGIGAHQELLDRLGPHTTGVGSVYIKDLEVVDLAVLAEIVARSYRTLTAGTYRHRARDSGG